MAPQWVRVDDSEMFSAEMIVPRVSAGSELPGQSVTGTEGMASSVTLVGKVEVLGGFKERL